MADIRRGTGQSARPTRGLRAEDIGCPGPKPAAERSERRGTVILLQHGDAEISGAIADGILAARAALPAAEEPDVTHTTVVEVVTERDPARLRTLVRVAVGNTRTDEDYRLLIAKARGSYAQPVTVGPLRRLGRALINAYGLICYAVAEAYDAQRHVLEPGRGAAQCLKSSITTPSASSTTS